MGEQSSVKYLGLTAGDSFSPHPLHLLTHPLPTSPQFFPHPRRAPSLAHFFACLFNLRLEKERKGLLHRLLYTMNSSLMTCSMPCFCLYCCVSLFYQTSIPGNSILMSFYNKKSYHSVPTGIPLLCNHQI